MFSHFDKHLLPVGKSERFSPRPLQLRAWSCFTAMTVTLDLVGLVEEAIVSSTKA
jgi:hypothetical protein